MANIAFISAVLLVISGEKKGGICICHESLSSKLHFFQCTHQPYKDMELGQIVCTDTSIQGSPIRQFFYYSYFSNKGLMRIA